MSEYSAEQIAAWRDSDRKHYFHAMTNPLQHQADVRLGNVFDRNANILHQHLRVVANQIAQRLSKSRVIENTNRACIQKVCHTTRIAHLRQRAGDDNTVVARHRPQHAVLIPLRQQMRIHRRLRCTGLDRATFPCMVPALPA